MTQSPVTLVEADQRIVQKLCRDESGCADGPAQKRPVRHHLFGACIRRREEQKLRGQSPRHDPIRKVGRLGYFTSESD